MAAFYPLTVADIRRDTRDSAVLTLAPRAEDRDAFRFTQGQYLTFRHVFDGEELRRCYSICSGLDDATLRVGVRKVDGGWFSTFVNDEVAVGDVLEAMKPMGNFHAPLAPERRRRYLGVAGGSGITPVISILRTALAREPLASFTLVYANRSVNTIMFREELEELKNRNMGRLSIVHLLETEAPDIDLFAGRLDREKCDALFSRWVDPAAFELAFICGPEPMMLAAADALKARGMKEEAIRFELFASARPGKPRARAETGAARAGGDGAVPATIVLDGVARPVSIRRDGETVLEAALAAGVDVPYACKAGVCSTCRAKIVEGEVEMDANYALEDYEVARGYALTCQSRPLTDRLVVDYDQ